MTLAPAALPCSFPSQSSAARHTDRASADGVWPISNRRELDALRSLAATFGAGLALDRTPDLSALAHPAADGGVVAIGPIARDAAALHGRLTGRTVEHHERLTPRVLDAAVDVIVADARALSSDDLAAIYESRDRETMPGLVCGGSPEELRLRVLLASAAARLSNPVRVRWIDLMPLQPVAHEEADDRVLVGGAADGDAVARAMGAGAGLLRMFTHSDGICAYLGSRVLCPLLDSWPVRHDARRRPACILRSRCHRLHLPLDEALGDARLVSPAAVHARILMLGTCYGFLPATAIVEPVWSHTDALLSHGRVGAIVATWGLSFGADEDFDPLAEDIDAGLPLGLALARFSRTDAARSGRIRQCLLGDPRVRLPGNTREPREDPVLPPTSGRADAVAGDFLTWIVAMGEAAGRGEQRRAALAHARAVAASALPLSDADRMIVLRAIADLGSMPSKLWLSLGGALRRSGAREGPCATCGQSTLLFDTTLSIAEGRHRQLVVCANCGILDDRPAGQTPLRLALDGTLLRIVGALDFASTALVRIESFGKEQVRWREWRTPADAGASPTIDVAGELPRGHGFASVFLLNRRRELRVLTVPMLHAGGR